MKKLVALLLALTMVLGLAACGNGDTTTSEDPATSASQTGEESQTPESEEPSTGEITDPDSIDDDMLADDGVYQIAFVTDVGALKDKSFNQGTYDGVKLYAANNGLTYKYYQPANGDQATDDDRYDAMVAAAEGGAEVIVCAGYLQEAAIRRAANAYPDIPFIFIDGYPIQAEATEVDADGNALPNDSPILENVAGISFQE